MLYIVYNNQKLAPKQLIILPYLHERRIYLNRTKKNTHYFYTTFDKKIGQNPSEKDQSYDSSSSHSSSNTSEIDDSPENLKVIVCMNLTEHKLYAYKGNGVLIKRQNY